jgi:transcriptional regulator with XRE-family HTH domain
MLTPFGLKVRQIRLEKGVKLLDLAGALGKSAAYVSAIETGRKPLPDHFEQEVAEVLQLTADEKSEVFQAADRTREKLKVGGLSAESRELVAEFARSVDRLNDSQIEAFKKLIRDTEFKMAADETPFHRRRRGFLVTGRSQDAIWGIANRARKLLDPSDGEQFPVMEVIEFVLPTMIPGFVLDIRSSEELDGDEARAIPAKNMIVFAESTYSEACRGVGRARFTAAHELAHMIMHRDVEFARPSDDFPIYRDAEWQADTFAGALLMPFQKVRACADSDEVAEKCGVTFAAAEVMCGKYAQKYRT